jgi:penicillin-binding protein 1A
MQPQLVAGAWVGFNDPRITLRSDYWGQGAHNALHVVGDAMRGALAQGLVDPTAEFPTPAGAAIRELVRSAGETIRRWFGFGD